MSNRNLAADLYTNTDHANTFRQVQPASCRNTPETAQDYETLMRQGYVIMENLIDVGTCSAIRAEGTDLLGDAGRNGFEGRKTQRVYDVLSKTRSTDELATHPRILGMMDIFFQTGFLLSQSQIINILPDETAQALHTDDSFYRLPRPRQPLGAAAIWAIDDFTEKNGATVVIPGSHNWGDDFEGKSSQAIPAIMPAGSAIFFLGTTWHGGGKNNTNEARFAVTHQYCDAYLRQQENYLLELTKETVRSLSPELQALVGYSIYPPFMGMVNGMHPLRLVVPS